MPQFITNSAAIRTTFSSAGLTVNCSIGHPMTVPGNYVLLVSKREVCVGSVALQVVASDGSAGDSREAGYPKQATVDLFAAETLGRGQALHPPSQTLQVRQGGYLLLYASEGEGPYSAILRDAASRQEHWDSRQLTEGDLFSILALVPGSYSVTAGPNGAHAAMDVKHHVPTDRVQGLPKHIDPVRVTFGKKGFEPSHWTTGGIVPVVITVSAAASFSIDLRQRADDGRSKEERLAQERTRLMAALTRLKQKNQKV